ncbi:MAG TPA: hypothetical protein VMU40_18970 [Steroidobacteraceae bacterium]|nr:hypothetical protein [Steroidobacteraceae bacterium]
MITATRVRAVKAYSDLIATWVTILGAFVGGIWALGEYRDKVRDDEVAATLRYQQQYNTTPMWEIRGRLETFWESRSKDIFDATAKGENVISDYVVKTLGADKTALADTGATIDFFAGLGTCLWPGCATLRVLFNCLERTRMTSMSSTTRTFRRSVKICAIKITRQD